MGEVQNHITAKLDEIDVLKEDTESLLNTIKLPRQLGQITNVMPASQYAPSPRVSDAKRIKELVSNQQKPLDGFQNELKEKVRLQSAVQPQSSR